MFYCNYYNMAFALDNAVRFCAYYLSFFCVCKKSAFFRATPQERREGIKKIIIPSPPPHGGNPSKH